MKIVIYKKQNKNLIYEQINSQLIIINNINF